MADLDDVDPLDDLLRDTSGNKFGGNSMLQVTSNKEAKLDASSLLEQPKKSRKSALMAELFGTPPDTIFDDVSGHKNLSDTKSSDKPALSSTEDYIPSFSSRPASAIKDLAFSNEAYEPKTIGQPMKSYKPSIPAKKPPAAVEAPPLSSSILQNFSLDRTEGDSAPGKLPMQLCPDNSAITILPPQSSGTKHEQDSQACVSKPTPSNPGPTADASKLEQILEKLVDIFDRFPTVQTSNNFEEQNKIVTGLETIGDILKSIANKQVLSENSPGDPNTEHRLSRVESLLEAIKSENADMKSSMQRHELQLKQQRESMDILRKELDNTLNNRIESVLLQSKHCQAQMDQDLKANLNEQRTQVASQLSDLELQIKKIKELDLQGKPADKAEASQVFQQELKWLQKWKEKLYRERKELDKLRKEISKRMTDFDTAFQKIHEMSMALEEERLLQQSNAQHLNQQWLKLRQKEDNLAQMRKQMAESLANKTKSSVLTLGASSSAPVLRMLIEQDEKLVREQQQFIASLKNQSPTKI